MPKLNSVEIFPVPYYMDAKITSSVCPHPPVELCVNYWFSKTRAGVCAQGKYILCHKERMSCNCRSKVHFFSPVVQLLLSTLHFPNVFLNRVGSSLQYPETGIFPWTSLDFAASLTLARQAWASVNSPADSRVRNGAGGKAAELKTGTSHPDPRYRPQTFPVAIEYTMQKKRFFAFFILHLKTVTTCQTNSSFL